MLDGLRSLTVALPLLAAAAIFACFPGGQARAAEGDRMTSGNEQRRPAIVIADLAYYSDDSVALLMLLQSRAVDIMGIITTAGNVCAGQSAKDARRVLQVAGAASLPVIEGPSMAWHEVRRRYYRDVEMPSWPKRAYAGALETSAGCSAAPSATEGDMRAADYLIDAARKQAGELVVILQGPATVLAQALKKEARLPELLAHVYAMGGNLNVPGNVTDAAEFNIWFDPDAMSDLLRSGTGTTLVPLDATETVTFGDISHAGLKGRGAAAEFLGEYVDFRRSRSGRALMWDEVLAAVVIDPSIALQSQRLRLDVSTRKDPGYGRLSIARERTASRQKAIDVILKVDAARVRAMVTNLLVHK